MIVYRKWKIDSWFVKLWASIGLSWNAWTKCDNAWIKRIWYIIWTPQWWYFVNDSAKIWQHLAWIYNIFIKAYFISVTISPHEMKMGWFNERRDATKKYWKTFYFNYPEDEAWYCNQFLKFKCDVLTSIYDSRFFMLCAFAMDYLSCSFH